MAKILVDKVICVHGCPKQILTDQSPNFESQLFARCIAVRSVPESMPGRSTTSNQEQYSRESEQCFLAFSDCRGITVLSLCGSDIASCLYRGSVRYLGTYFVFILSYVSSFLNSLCK